MSALQTLGRLDKVRGVGADAMKVTGQVLEKRPGKYVGASRPGVDGREPVRHRRVRSAPRKALALSEQEVRDWEAIVALDPSNQIAWNNLVSARAEARDSGRWPWAISTERRNNGARESRQSDR